MVSSLCLHSRISASACRNAFLGLLGAFLLLNPVGARADIYHLTFTNVTFTATCIGGGTCTEVFNGSADYDNIADTTANLSATLTGTLNVSFVFGFPPQCNVPGCFGTSSGRFLYDPNALPGFNPIELDVEAPTFVAPSPIALSGGPDGTLLFVPGGCGGDQPKCNTAGAFPGNPNTDYQLTSGTYTSVYIGPSPVPEPGSSVLFATGMAMLGSLFRSRRRNSSGISSEKL
jgi:hypothetical protein